MRVSKKSHMQKKIYLKYIYK